MTIIPSFEVIDMTPAMAAELLGGQAPNRNQKDLKIAGFARDMAAGRWLFTGEAIKLDRDGRMLDGQNRCLACIKSGATIRVLIIRGLDPEAQEVMDTGTPRGSRDALKFAGYSETKDLSAAIVVHRAWKMGAFSHCMSTLGYHSRPTNSESVAYAAAHPYLVDAAVAAKHIYGQGLRLPVGAVATALVETSAIDHKASADFFDRITNLRTSGAGDPVQTLLKRVQSIRDEGRLPIPSTSLFLLFRAWNAYRSGESFTKFQLGAPGRDGVPASWAKIPEPK